MTTHDDVMAAETLINQALLSVQTAAATAIAQIHAALETLDATVEEPPPVVTPPVDTTDYTVYPGRDAFGANQSNGYILQLTTWLSQRGGTLAPTKVWSQDVQNEVAAFQSAQGWTGTDADGSPGPTSWSMLAEDTGHDIGYVPPPSGWVDSVAIDSHSAVQFTRYTGGGTVTSWIQGACAAHGITDTTAVAAWTRGYQTAIARESSGNANACNRNDLNNVTPSGYQMVHDYGDGYPGGYLAGALTNYQCSRGVAQCIPQTFARFHCPGTSTMIYDPVANIAASMGYVRATYGVSADGSDLASRVQQFDPNRPPRGY